MLIYWKYRDIFCQRGNILIFTNSPESKAMFKVHYSNKVRTALSLSLPHTNPHIHPLSITPPSLSLPLYLCPQCLPFALPLCLLKLSLRLHKLNLISCGIRNEKWYGVCHCQNDSTAWTQFNNINWGTKWNMDDVTLEELNQLIAVEIIAFSDNSQHKVNKDNKVRINIIFQFII